MITAKEANQLSTNSKANVDYTLKIIEKMIMEQTNKGYYSLELKKPINNISFELSDYNVRNSTYPKEQIGIINALRELGYTISSAGYLETIPEGVFCKKEKQIEKRYVAIYWWDINE